MSTLTLGLFKHIEQKLHVENGLAVADNDNNPIVDGEFKRVYEKDDGHINSKQLAIAGDYMRTPGKYSGEMRKVVQALLSRGRPVVYDYKATKTHGIYTASDNSKWVIEIYNGGVYALPLTVLDTMNPEHAWLGYSPAYDANFQQAERIQLLNTAGVSGFYDKIFHFFACGWAFNTTGNKASNTCYTTDENETPTGYLYTITISETNNTPSGALMSLVSSGEYKLPKLVGGLALPDDNTNSVAQYYTDQDAPCSDGEAPLYVYYDDNTLIEITAYYKNTETTVYDDDNSYSASWVHCGVGFPHEKAAYGNEYKVGTEVSGGKGVYIKEKFLPKYPHQRTGSFEIDKTGIEEVPGHAYEYEFYNNTYKLSREKTNTTDEIYEPIMSVIIPLFDRESAYQVIAIEEQNASYSKTEAVDNGYDRLDGYWPYGSNAEGCKRARTAVDYGPKIFRATGFWPNKCVLNGYYNCPGETRTTYRSCYTTTEEDGTASNSLQVHFISSSGEKEIVNNNDGHSNPYTLWPEGAERHMVSHPDAANTAVFFSNEMNGYQGGEYETVGGVDKVTYPIDTLQAGFIKFWIGEP